MRNFSLNKKNVGLLLIDVQEKVFDQVERPKEVLIALQQICTGFRIMQLPILISEQYPQGLGKTICALKECWEPNQTTLSKTTFSCMGDENIKKLVLSMAVSQWVVAGVEAHICVLQTVRDLINAKKEVVVLNDAISSRSIYDFSTAIAEMRDLGARISSTETVLFELLKDSKAPEFREISLLVK